MPMGAIAINQPEEKSKQVSTPEETVKEEIVEEGEKEEKKVLTPMKKKSSTGLSAEELGYVATAKDQGLNQADFKEWLTENKSNIGLTDEKIDLLVKEL